MNQNKHGYDATLPRRDFLRLTAASTLLTALPMRGTTSPVRAMRGVPDEKGLSPEWIKSLTARGRRTIFKGAELRSIGMPVGGVGAGQVNLGGDGRLWLWDVFNKIKFGVVEKTITFQGQQIHAGGGANYVESPDQVHPFEQGLTLRVRSADGTKVRPLDKRGWEDIKFNGEYPVGTVEYRDSGSPVTATLQAFSPFIPLETDDSCLPATILRVTIKNTSKATVGIDLAGYLENPVGLHTIRPGEAKRVNRVVRDDQCALIEASLKAIEQSQTKARAEILFDNFERETWAPWVATGTAFGPGPYAKEKMAGYQGDVGGSRGSTRVVNTHNARNGEDVGQADAHVGRLTSPKFTIERRYINFWIGGGNHAEKTCLHLIVDGKIVRTTTGKADNRMAQSFFDVREFEGKTAHLEFVDEVTGAWGHIGGDEIVFSDVPPSAVPVEERPDFGNMSLAVLGNEATWSAHGLSASTVATACFDATRSAGTSEAPIPGSVVSAIGRTFDLAPGASKTVTFVISWWFPNLKLNVLGDVGWHYAARFPSSGAVANYIAKNEKRLVNDTLMWRETWYDSTLPYWLLDRTLGNACTLATMTCVRFNNGRFYGWEGIGCCDGTCGHVWAYAQSLARFFPDLERGIRERVDFDRAYHKDTGIIDFRGEYGNGYAVDSQAGYVLRTYREHQTSKDSAFLKRVYDRVKKSLEYMIIQDGDNDGIITNRQHNTLDVDLYGPSSWLSSLYLAALRAGEEMALETGDKEFAIKCRKIFETGSAKFVGLLWNGEYFIHKPGTTDPNTLIYGNGCQVDQVMGQWWAHQLGLGRILDEEHTKKALASLYRYNFLTDVGPFREKQKAGRWYAVPGESGLLICSFPQGDREAILGKNPVWSSMYFNECMTGFEYEAAAHMVMEGLLTEGLAVTRAVHDRYHASKRNPWNEVECSDHYARCMAAHSVFTGVCGFDYHGPKGHLGFGPKLTPENFKAPFNVAEGWGTFIQKRTRGEQRATVWMRWGSLHLKTLALEVTDGRQVTKVTAKVGRKSVTASVKQSGGRVLVTLGDSFRIMQGQRLEVVLT